MTAAASVRVLRGACWLALSALGLIVWSLLDPRPIPVIVAMSVGQVLGTLSLFAFLTLVSIASFVVLLVSWLRAPVRALAPKAEPQVAAARPQSAPVTA